LKTVGVREPQEQAGRLRRGPISVIDPVPDEERLTELGFEEIDPGGRRRGVLATG
jgi:hypothetical protein